MVTTLTIVRHGNTFETGEAPRRIGARTDLPLTSTGVAQAQALGRWFAVEGVRFDLVLASPLRRTTDTAGLILSEQADPPAIEARDWLAEIDHGPDEDQPEDAVRARIGAAALDAWNAQGVVPPGWLVDADMRIAAWQRLFATSAGPSRILAVTSNGAARFALLADPVLAEAAAALPSLALRTGAYGTIELRDGAPHLLAWDQRPPATLRPPDGAPKEAR